MGLFGKIKEILFDEETVEIPVITKEEKTKEKEASKEKNKVKENVSRTNKNDDEVIIKKIETPKRETVKSDDLFDMPKFKEEVKEEKKANSFTFPVFNDDETPEIVEPKRTRRSAKSYSQDALVEDIPKRVNNQKNSEVHEHGGGYTTAYDYSYGKYKGDYKTSRETNHNVLTKTLETRDEHTTFTPSPIISPVYGVLNENYKKEDIITKHETRKITSTALDLDSVRRKAYGTLEDEIENSLDRQDAFFGEPLEDDNELLDEENGISIDDLLVDAEENDTLDEINDQTGEIELFDVLNKDEIREPDFGPHEEIEITEAEDVKPLEEVKTVGEMEEINLDDDIEESPIIVVNDDDVKTTREKRVPKANVMEVEEEKESLGEEDLFDLIDSLYDGKGEE